MQTDFLVADIDTGQPIPRASVVIVDQNNTTTGAGAIAGDDGYVYLNSPYLDNLSYNLMVSSIGYQTQVVDAQDANTLGVNLKKAAQNLPAVVITAKPKTTTGNQTVVYAGLGLLGLLLLTSKKKKVSGIDQSTLLTVAVVGVGGYLIVKTMTKPAVTQPQVIYQQPALSQIQPSQGNSTSAIISSAGGAAAGILTAISNF